MGFDTATLMPAVLLGIMVALTLILLPHLNADKPHRRYDEPLEQALHEQAEASANEQQSPDQHHV